MTRLLAASALLAVLATATPALAQVAPSQPAPAAPAPPPVVIGGPGLTVPMPIAPAPVDDVEPRSESTAFALSAGLTAVGIVAVVAGTSSDSGELVVPGVALVFFGPSAGHWYAGKVVTTGLAIRSVGVVSSTVGTIGLLGCAFSEEDEDSSCGAFPLLMVGGSIATLVGVVWDISTTASSVRDWNRRHGFDVTIAPTVINGAGGHANGLAVSGRF